MNSRIIKTREFAREAHKDQLYDGFPYILHLHAAYMVGRRFGVDDPDVLDALWLHDLVEDTTFTTTDVNIRFGTRVADIVDLVTEPKGTRKERHAYSYPRIAKDGDARVVKLCDRISHLEWGGSKVGMYVKEHEGFKEAFGPHLTWTERALWIHLDKLIFEAT